MIEKEKRITLLEKLKARIGERHKVSQDEVTLDFIREHREMMYSNPEYRFENDSYRGGYISTALEPRSLVEIAAEAHEVDEFLEQFASDKE